MPTVSLASEYRWTKRALVKFGVLGIGKLFGGTSNELGPSESGLLRWAQPFFGLQFNVKPQTKTQSGSSLP